VRNAVCLVALVSVCALSGCSSGSGDSGPSASAAAPASASAHAGHASPGASLTAEGAAATPPSSPAEAAIRLESLLGQHSLLAADMMRARVRSDADLAQAANAALGKNTQAMGALLEPVIGKAGVSTFGEAWGEHITSLFDYARGLADDDKAVTGEAREEVVEYEEELADFFVEQSDGRLNHKAALAAVSEHVDHLLAGAEAYADGDVGKATDLYRTAYAHSFTLGDSLARALLPDEVGEELDTPSLRLRAALTQLLGEHVSLVVAAMRSAATGSDDFSALGDGVNANTLDLTAAIDALFGAEAAKAFQAQWADHVDGLVDYTRATVAKDPAAQEQVRQHLRGFEQSFATFLDGATEQRLGKPALAQVFVMHDRMLLAQIDAYAAKDFEQAHDLSYQTYDEMFTVSGQLATAIGSTVAKRLPTGGSQTGGGGAAGAVQGR
jgi:hypothetical protein